MQPTSLAWLNFYTTEVNGESNFATRRNGSRQFLHDECPGLQRVTCRGATTLGKEYNFPRTSPARKRLTQNPLTTESPTKDQTVLAAVTGATAKAIRGSKSRNNSGIIPLQEGNYNRVRFESDTPPEKMHSGIAARPKKPWFVGAFFRPERPPSVRPSAESRVEKWRGGLGGAYRLPALSVAGASLASPCSVSTSRSSNRACGFLAHGSPTGFAHQHTRCRFISVVTPKTSPLRWQVKFFP